MTAPVRSQEAPLPAEAWDERLMAAANSIGRRNLGQTFPNPAVGALIVRFENGEPVVVARGYTAEGGRPHAETEALRLAGDAARGATTYVTLEPCAHHGKTPPCAEAVVAAGIARVVAAIEDPFPEVNGRGLAVLRQAGIQVETGLGADEARAINQGFLTRVAERRPMVTLKLATSLDGRIATRTGESRWITGEAARRQAHLLRATHDAVMVGIGTALADDPQLTCRLPGLEARRGVRVAMDSDARLPLDGKLVRSARKTPLWVVVRQGADDDRVAALQAAGAEVLRVLAGPDNRPDPAASLEALGRQGLTRVLVEGGGVLAAALLRAGLVDRLVWFRAPLIIGGDGIPAIAGIDAATLAETRKLRLLSAVAAGGDIVETYRRAE